MELLQDYFRLFLFKPLFPLCIKFITVIWGRGRLQKGLRCKRRKKSERTIAKKLNVELFLARVRIMVTSLIFKTSMSFLILWGKPCFSCQYFTIGLVMVSPWTHLVKNHESQSRTIESHFKKQWVPGSFVTTQLIWRQTPKLCIIVYWNENILLLL